MRTTNLTRFDTAASSVGAKSHDTAILFISGIGLIGLAVAGYTLAVSLGIGRETIEPLIFIP
jgi:hypothetical protein